MPSINRPSRASQLGGLQPDPFGTVTKKTGLVSGENLTNTPTIVWDAVITHLANTTAGIVEFRDNADGTVGAATLVNGTLRYSVASPAASASVPYVHPTGRIGIYFPVGVTINLTGNTTTNNDPSTVTVVYEEVVLDVAPTQLQD